MGFFNKIDNVSGSNIIKKVLHWRSGKMFVTMLVCKQHRHLHSFIKQPAHL